MNYRKSRKNRKKSVYRKVRGIGERFVKLHVHYLQQQSTLATVAAIGYTPNQHSTISLTRYYLQLDDPGDNQMNSVRVMMFTNTYFQQYFSYIVAVSFIGGEISDLSQVTDKLYHIMLYQTIFPIFFPLNIEIMFSRSLFVLFLFAIVLSGPS